MKITIVGAGSSYTPEIVDGLIMRQEKLQVTELGLTDTNKERLEILAGLTKRMIAAAKVPIKVHYGTDRRKVLSDSDFVITQIRVGGNKQRAIDERICIQHNIIGQETTGAAGFAKALRTIPAMLEIAKDVEEVAPYAWLVNYTNPSGIITEAVLKHTQTKIIGLCSGHLHHRGVAAKALNVSPERIKMDYFGLNHLNWASRYYLDGKDVTETVFANLSDELGVDLELVKTMQLLPIGYLGWYYHTDRALENLKKAAKTRGEKVMEIESQLFEAYKDPKLDKKPELLANRGGGGYAEVSFDAIDSLLHNRGDVQIVNAFNCGATPDLPADAVMEIPCVISSHGVRPLVIGHLPLEVRGLVQAVKSYEDLTVQAAVTGDRTTALMALLAHPLVPSYEVAKTVLAELLEASRDYLPQFFA